jgi:hypothetical protein
LTASASLLKFVLFADDSNIQVSGKDPKQLTETLTKELEHSIDWFKVNKLLLNVSKTKMIVFRSQKCNKDIDSFPVTMESKILSRVEHETFLGLDLDENLRWYAQGCKAAVKIGRSLASMRKVKQFVVTNAFKMMYNSMILPHLSYGIAAWGETFDKATKRIKVQQKKAI